MFLVCVGLSAGLSKISAPLGIVGGLFALGAGAYAFISTWREESPPVSIEHVPTP